MKKLFAGLILLFTISILGACSDDRSFSIDEVTINAQIQEDGSIHVRELFTYTFNGSYEGMTRSIESDSENFHAFLLKNGGADPTVSTKNLDPLDVEEEDNTYSIFSDSDNETKNVLYSYNVEGSVKKYTDVADLTYAFFDESNETDLHDVAITIQPPEGTGAKNRHFFLHGDESGNLTTSKNGIQYESSLIEAGSSSPIRFVFPSNQLTEMELTRDKPIESEILATEQELAARAENLESNMSEATPVIWGLLIAMVAASISIPFIHPNRYRGNKDQDSLRRLIEENDPLFIKYLHGNLHLPDDSFIAGLFSLKQRGIVQLEKVPSPIKENESTYRFTWVNEQAKIDNADQFLREWLFTESDEGGNYFLLESLIDYNDESTEVKEKKAEQFNANFEKWADKVKNRDSYQHLRKPFKGFSLLSVPMLIAAFGLFYYFTTIDTIGPTEQWVLPSIAGAITVLGLLFNKNKWVLSAHYFIMLVMTAVGFTLMPAVILTLVFYGLSIIVLLLIPAFYWNKEIRRLKYAIHQAVDSFKDKRYPIGNDSATIERRLESAIVLGVGEDYGIRCGSEVQFSTLETYYPLLQNPVYATTSFSVSHLALYSVAIQAGSNTTTSATGGGGAGAF
ncbi:DUF2207 domain-containing protein [Lentibacillus salicampi]|uniref:DUF2207 domain-containing protein n=1 Tax=Lentibacillus salicampi TaxID=175306 RepID=A0A4Y9AFL0_9BACI|nr:DUF2207 domain-containing protein [Lentibacillus salicampi]TFJ94648.1 DUF2207 domain-containing protein [Lentibacillus salicampi]